MNYYKWTVNGSDVTEEAFNNIDLGITFDTKAIPEDVVASTASDNEVMQLSLNHEGEFGFTSSLSFNVDKELSGKNAVLYYYNPEGKLEKQDECVVGDDGTVTFKFTHASDYVVVYEGTGTDAPVTPDEPSDEPSTPETPDTPDTPVTPETPDKGDVVVPDTGVNDSYLLLAGFVTLSLITLTAIILKKKYSK